jgi:glycosyltransferase involved in cell wall biosynthesis
MIDYWRERGVTVPIEVVGRPINPETFSKPAGNDPYPANFKPGKRLVVVCRHDREKSLDELIEIFDEHIAEADRDVTLTLIGDGADHQNLLAQANRCRHANRIYFTGEVDHERFVDWYSHADLFVYTSISETFGNVVNEALWCGLPCVCYDDQMGVAHQVQDQVNGFLVEPNRIDSHAAFASSVLTITSNQSLKQEMGQQAATIARQRSHPDVIISKFEGIYEDAMRRCHDEITEPLCEQSRTRQMAELAKATARWTTGHATVLAVAKAATSAGFGRIVEDDTAVAGTAADVMARDEEYAPELRDAAE